MKSTVRRYFADAETGDRYEAGDTFRGTPERIAELQGAGVLERDPEPGQEPEPDPLAEYRRPGGMYEFPPAEDGGEPVRVRGRTAAQAELERRG